MTADYQGRVKRKPLKREGGSILFTGTTQRERKLYATKTWRKNKRCFPQKYSEECPIAGGIKT